LLLTMNRVAPQLRAAAPSTPAGRRLTGLGFLAMAALKGIGESIKEPVD
jgi:hypothetical protein